MTSPTPPTAPFPISPPAPPQIPAELVQRAIHQDRDAVTELLTMIQPLLLRYCRARLVGHLAQVADDTAQEIAIAVLGALPRYREQGNGLLPWLYTIAARKVADVQRALYRHPAQLMSTPPEAWPAVGIGTGVDAGDPVDVCERRDQAAELARLVDGLPERQREAVVLRIMWGLSSAEVAEVTASREGAVRVALHRGLGALRARLTRSTGELPNTEGVA